MRCVVHVLFDGDVNKCMAERVLDTLESCLETHVRTDAVDVHAREDEVDRVFSETVGSAKWVEVTTDEQNEDDARG